MNEIASVSSSDEGPPSSAESEVLQSAQRSHELERREQEELISENDELSDAFSVNEATSSSLVTKEAQVIPANEEGTAQQSGAENEDSVVSDDELSPSPPLPTRPNKHLGPASTWRNWTAPERDLAASLNRLRAKDLTVHLYNAFKLKQRASTLLVQQESGDEDAIVEAATWSPPKVWTAWPLPPDVVPREDDERHWEGDDMLSYTRQTRLGHPSETLRELLVAQLLRKAKERFIAREWEDEDQETTGVQPVIMADDERALEILRPTIQHILTNLDRLLVGLHHARNFCLAINDDADESELESGDTRGSTSKSRGRKRKRKPSARDTESSKISEQHSRSELNNAEESRSFSGTRSGSKRPGSYSRNSSRTFHKRKLRLGLRDWSEVLGIASLTGWETTVVTRAAARCSVLFGEDISFRTLAERESENYVETTCLSSTSVPGIFKTESYPTGGSDTTAVGKMEVEMFGGVHIDGFLKPIEGKKSWKYGGESGKGRDRPRKKKT